jgi:hypothetical protein
MAQEMSPALYAAHIGIEESTVWEWINGRSSVIFDERDIRPVNGHLWLIAVQAPNAAGRGARPQFKENPTYRYTRKRKSVHEARRGGAMQVVPVERAGVPGMPQPAAEHVQGDASLGMVGGEGMAEALEVADREAGA